MLEMNLRLPGFIKAHVDHLLETKKEYEKLNKGEIQDILI